MAHESTASRDEERCARGSPQMAEPRLQQMCDNRRLLAAWCPEHLLSSRPVRREAAGVARRCRPALARYDRTKCGEHRARAWRDRRVAPLYLAFVVALAIAALPPAGASAAPAQLFTFRDPQIAESSGIVASTRRDDIVFTHNDSGDTARFFAIDRHGCTIGVFTAPQVRATDWEDIARGPGGSLWLGDTGDNDAKRGELAVHRFAEPAVGASTDGGGCPAAPEQAVAPSSYRLRYEDGPHDAETLLVDPHTSQLFVITKGLTAGALYAAPNPLSTDDV